MASIIMAFEPLPDSGFIRAVGRAGVKSVFTPRWTNTQLRALTM